jgi:hypothetical protein
MATISDPGPASCQPVQRSKNALLFLDTGQFNYERFVPIFTEMHGAAKCSIN